MKTYEAKYQVGQHVFTLARGSACREVNCTPCENSGKVTIGGTVYDCPGCHGRGKQTAHIDAWSVSDQGPVGKLEITETAVEHVRDFDDEDEPVTLWVKYILRSTGGTVHPERNVFPTRAEAEAECEKRNVAFCEHLTASQPGRWRP